MSGIGLNYAIDLDGTLAEWEKVEGYHQPTGAWIEGASDALREILSDRDTGRVVVHTCRATWPGGGGWQAVAAFLWSGGFDAAISTEGDDTRELWTPLQPPSLMLGPTVGIWLGRGKPIADVYIDDRGAQFTKEIGWPRMVVIAKAIALDRVTPDRLSA